MKKFFMVLLSLTLLLSTTTFTSSAEGDFTMKEFDKAYITFVFDDGNMPFTKECYYLFKAYNTPMCCAVVANKVDNNPELISILKEVEKSGGEVLSHTYTHSAFSKNSTVSDFEFQLKNSYVHLAGLGFKINGVIEAGSGGGEAEANYELMETVTRKYYKYSNAYGVSPQYKKKRTWFSYASDKVAFAKAEIDRAIQNKEWIVFAAHSFNEISQEDMSEVLRYIKSKSANEIAVVNWNYIYENFGEYTGPQVPTAAALKAVENYKKKLAENSKPTSTTSQNDSSQDTYTPSYSNNNTASASNSKSQNSSSDNAGSQSTNPNNSNTAGNTVNNHSGSSSGNSQMPNSNTESSAENSQAITTSSTPSSQSQSKKNEDGGLSKKILTGAIIIGVTIIICALAIFFILKIKK